MLKEKREGAGLDQAGLSERSGVNIRTIQVYEQQSRDINNARLLTLLSLSVALKCRVRDLVTDPVLLDLCKKAKL